jgi:hypothetical protein
LTTSSPCLLQAGDLRLGDDHQSPLRRKAYPAGKEIAMKAEPKLHRRAEIRHRRRAARTARAIKPTAAPDPKLLERPDGIYWQAAEGEEAFGPFETYELARADFLRGDEERPAPGETLEDAEAELGLNSWVDEDTGEVAQGQSPPHLPRP